jgi:hypothetical protein
MAIHRHVEQMHLAVDGDVAAVGRDEHARVVRPGSVADALEHATGHDGHVEIARPLPRGRE